MLRKYLITILTILLLLVAVAPANAFWWMVYHKPAFKGKVIDAETKEPIEGAVVVAVYDKATIGLGAGALSSTINVREVLTDKEGMFHIPSYTTIIQPFSVEGDASFIIFKPGYGSFPWYRVNPPMELSLPAIQEFFSGETGAQGEIGWDYKKDKKIKVTFGIVELPKLKTREERRKALPSIPGANIPEKKIKNLLKAIDDERLFLYGPSGPIYNKE